jgi:hypothetical protein
VFIWNSMQERKATQMAWTAILVTPGGGETQVDGMWVLDMKRAGRSSTSYKSSITSKATPPRS